MGRTNTKRHIASAAVIASLTVAGLPCAMPCALAEEYTEPDIIVIPDETLENDNFIVFGQENLSSDSNNNDNNSENSESSNEQMLGEPAVSETSIGPTTGNQSRGVSTLEELESALKDPSVRAITFMDDIRMVKDVLTIGRDLTLNLNKKMLLFDDSGYLQVTGGNVEVRNGSVYAYTTADEAAAIVQTGGNLTLAGNLDIYSYYVNGVVTRNDSTLTIDDADITCNSERHAAINAQDTSSVLGKRVTLRARSNAKAVSEATGADVTLKLGTYFIDSRIKVSPYLASGYTLTSSVSGLYESRADIEGSEVGITVSPETYTYDGKRKEPTVTVTYDGEDVSDECTVSYTNNTEVGTATATIEAKATSDKITGKTTREFTISASDGSSSTDPTTGNRSVEVSSLAGLKAALADTSVRTITFMDDIRMVKDVLTIGRDLTLNLNKKMLLFDDSGYLQVTGGNVEVRNGSVYAYTTADEAAAIVQTGGRLTLGAKLDIYSYNVNGVLTKNKASLTIDDADITCNSERHAAINAQDTSRVVADRVTLSARSNAKAVSEATDADVTLKLGTYHVDKQNMVSPYLASGYTLTSSVSGLYESRADIEGSEVGITVSPETFQYDGKRKEPTVTVTYDGEDVTKECFITYSNNTEAGTATVTIKAMATSDKITGETSREFTIEQSDVTVKSADITLIPSSYTYDGKAKEPGITVEVDGKYVSNSNYKVTYSNNTNAGTATATITFNSGSGYKGTVKKEFTINQKEVTVTPISSSKRAGEADPQLKASVYGTVGNDTVNYTLSRQSGETAGTYTINATGSASQGNYKVTFKTGTFTIIGSATNNSNSNNNNSSSRTTTSNSGNNNANTDSNSNTGAATATRAATATAAATPTTATAATGSQPVVATTTATPVAKTPATADTSFASFGALISAAAATLGFGLFARRDTKE